MHRDEPAQAPARAARATSTAFTWQLAIFLLFNVALLNGLAWRLSPGGFDDTVLRQSWDMLRGVGGDDSWGPMAAALNYLQESGEKPLYGAVFFEEGIKFQYPPSALLALEAMLAFGEERVRTSDEMAFSGLPPINDLAGWAFLFLTALASAALLEAGLRRALATDAYDMPAFIRTILTFVFTLTFYPAIKAFTLGQIQLWINSIFAAAMLAFVLGGKSASGALMGVICLMKPHYGLFALWGGFNREWRFASACVAVAAVGGLVSIWMYGWANHIDYLRVLSFMSERGESYFANQSMNGLLNRLAGLAAPGAYANTAFDAYGFPPYTPWVYWGTLVSSAFILLAALLRRSDADSRTLAFSIVAVSLTLASPIAWEHHYGVFLPVFAFVAGSLAGQPKWLAALAVCYVCVSNFVPAFNQLADTPLNIFQSYMLAGGLGFLIVMHSYIHASHPAENDPITLKLNWRKT
jgi:hypothetical protein